MSDSDSPEELLEDSKRKEFEARVSSVYGIASGLLTNDIGFIPILYIILILPDLLASVFQLHEVFPIGLEVLKRVIYLSFVYLVVNRWASRFSTEKLGFEFSGLLIMNVVGFCFGALFAVPVVFFDMAAPELKFLFLALFIPAIHISLRFYFYFFPISMNIASPREIFHFAKLLTDQDRFLAIRALISPFAIMFLLVALLGSISPDGREGWVGHLAAILGGLYGVLATYLSLAFFLALIDEPTWRSWKLDPYRSSRLSTLAVQGRDWIAWALKPRAGIVFLGMGILIWAGNEARASNTVPAPAIAIEHVRIDGKRVILDLQLSDSEYQFRGFFPAHFALKGENGTAVSRFPEVVQLNGEMRDNRLSIPPGLSEIFLTLEFVTDREEKDLEKLRDLFLWYRNVKLYLLDLSSAEGA